MLAEARREAIMDTVNRERVVRVNDLAHQLGVSLMTIRRDIETLAESGEVHKVHGGAKAVGDSSAYEPGFEFKSTQWRSEKAAIAKRAAEYVQDGMAIGLSAGTTTWAFASLLRNFKDLTVVTNSIQVASIFHSAAERNLHNRNTVLLTGGERTPSDALVGPLAAQSLTNLNLDLVFMGVHGVDSEVGFTTPNMNEAEIDKALMRTAARVIVLADHTKWGERGVASIAAFSEVEGMISDAGLPPEAARFLQERLQLSLVDSRGGILEP